MSRKKKVKERSQRSVEGLVDWLPLLDRRVVLQEAAPFATFPSLDKEKLEAALAEGLGLRNCQLHYQVEGWKEEPLSPAVETTGAVLEITPAPLQTPLYFITTIQEIKQWMAHAFGSSAADAFFYKASYVEGFYLYIAGLMAHLLQSQGFAHPLSWRVALCTGDIAAKIQTPYYAIQVGWSAEEVQGAAEIRIPQPCQRAWRRYFLQQLPQETLSPTLPLEVALEVGVVSLTHAMWAGAKEGDYLILEEGSLSSSLNAGEGWLSVGGVPIFLGKWEGSHFTVRAGSTQYTQGIDNMEREEVEEDVADSSKEQLASVSASEKRETLPLAHVPLRVAVEVTRLRMTVGEIAALQPGAVLDLQLDVEHPVSLVVEGTTIGKGELVRLGETLAVRILSR